MWFLCFIQVVDLKKKAIFDIFLTFGQFYQKRGLIGQKQNNLSVQGGTFNLHPYFETYRVINFEPQSRFSMD